MFLDEFWVCVKNRFLGMTQACNGAKKARKGADVGATRKHSVPARYNAP